MTRSVASIASASLTPTAASTGIATAYSKTLSSTTETSHEYSHGSYSNNENSGSGSGHSPTMLNWSDAQFVGREQEMNDLETLFRAVIPDPDKDDASLDALGRLPAAFVWGVSGSGKSCLVQHFVRQQQRRLQQQQHGRTFYFLKGKHDEQTNDSDPLYSIVQLVSDFARQATESCTTRVTPASHPSRDSSSSENSADYLPTTISEKDRILKALRKNGVGKDDIRSLCTLAPALSAFLVDDTSSTKSNNGSINGSSRMSSVGTDTATASRDDSDGQLRTSRNPAGENSENNSAEFAWNRLRYGFTRFIKAVATSERPVVMFLDDLQWASDITLDLLSSLVADASIQNLLILGTVRLEIDALLNEPISNHRINMFIHTVESTAAKSLCQLTLTLLTKNELRLWLSKVFGSSSAAESTDSHHDMDELADAVYSKTGGNIFFATQLLYSLEHRRALVYQPSSCQWTWDISKIRGNSDGLPTGTGADDEIMNTVKTRLQQLPKAVQRVLTIAAFIRSRFSLDVLLPIWTEDCITNGHLYAKYMKPDPKAVDSDERARSADVLLRILERAVLEGVLVNPIGGNTYSFVHDRILQAAYQLVPFGEEQIRLRSMVGRNLLVACNAECMAPSASPSSASINSGSHTRQRHRKKKRQAPATSSNTRHDLQEDTAISHTVPSSASRRGDSGLFFVAADHLNSIPNKNHVFMVQMNLEAGERALDIAALAVAARYLQSASRAFKKVRHGWTEHYSLALRLLHTWASVELAIGHFDFGEMLCNELFSKARCMEDKLPTYRVLAKSYARQRRYQESAKLCKQATRSMKEFPRRRYYLLRLAQDLRPSMSYFKSHSDEDILSLPLKTNGSTKIVMNLLSELFVRDAMMKRMLEAVVALGRMLQITIRDGLCDETAFALVNLGYLVSGYDQPLAVRYCSLALKVLEKTNGRNKNGWVFLLAGIWVIAYNQSYSAVMRYLDAGYRHGMQSGDFEIGFLNWHNGLSIAFTDGHKLQKLSAKYRPGIQEMELYQVPYILQMAKSIQFGIDVLTGKISFHEDLIRYDQKNMPKLSAFDSGDRYYFGTYCRPRIQLCIYMFRYEWAEAYADAFEHAMQHDKTYDLVVPSLFYQGLAAAGRYRETKRPAHMKKLRHVSKKMRAIHQKRGLNSLRYSLILEAEVKSLTSTRPERIERAYEAAIAVAAHAGYVQDAAMACELAGEHFLNANEHEFIGDYFTRAVQLFHNWGCKLKVDHIMSRRRIYVDNTVCGMLTKSTVDNDTDGVATLRNGTIATTGVILKETVVGDPSDGWLVRNTDPMSGATDAGTVGVVPPSMRLPSDAGDVYQGGSNALCGDIGDKASGSPWHQARPSGGTVADEGDDISVLSDSS